MSGESNTQTARDLRTSEPDAYAAYLAEVNQSKEVVTTEDIVNERGVLLVRRGARVDQSVSKKLLQHRLQRPLENQVQIKDAMDGRKGMEGFQQLLARFPELATIHESLGFQSDFAFLMTGRPLPPVIRQKLTVLDFRMHDVFEKALFCAWLSALIAREMALDKPAIFSAFVAGLLHDIGFLHISPDILGKKGKLTPAEWRAIQGHVAIGELVLKGMSGVPDDVPRAVLEHHERCDGIGYPLGKSESELSQLGQIIAMADAMQAIRVNQFERHGRRIGDAMPYLQLNMHTHTQEVYRAMVAILRKAGMRPTAINTVGDDSRLVAQLVARTKLLEEVGELLQKLVAAGSSLQADRRGQRLRRVASEVIKIIASSGMTRSELAGWLDSLRPPLDEAILSSLSEIELMQNELNWQLGSSQKVFNEFLDALSDEQKQAHGELLTLNLALDGCLLRLKEV